MQVRLSLCASLVVSSARTTHLFFSLLPYSKSITHLGHILSEKLDDMNDDIKRVLKDLNCKANSILCTFHCADPVVKTFLIQSFCLSLYGGILWKLRINRLEVALNKILRKIWHLPPRSHSSIVLLYYRFLTFLKNTLSSPSPGSGYETTPPGGVGHDHVRAAFADSAVASPYILPLKF